MRSLYGATMTDVVDDTPLSRLDLVLAVLISCTECLAGLFTIYSIQNSLLLLNSGFLSESWFRIG